MFNFNYKFNQSYIITFFFFLLVLLSSIIYKRNEIIIWPATASLPAIYNKFDSKLFCNDFYAISSQETPVVYFQNFIYYITIILNIKPMETLALVGSFILVFYIPFFYLFFIKSYKNFLVKNNSNNIINFHLFNIFAFILCSIIIINTVFINSIITFMGWPPIFLIPAPYIISMFLILFSYISPNYFLQIIFTILSCIIHPSMAALTLTFCSVIYYNFYLKNELYIFFKSRILPLILTYSFLIFYFPQKYISTKDFADIYLKYRHSEHYLLSTNFPFLKYLFLIIFPLIIISYFLKKLKSKLFLNAIIAIVLSICIPVLHIFFTEIYIVKSFIIFGMPRFFMFSFFLVMFFSLILFVEYIKDKFYVIFIYMKLKNFIYPFFKKNIQIILFSISFIIIISVTKIITNEFVRINNNQSNFNKKFSNILSHIKYNDVVMIINDNAFELSLFGRINLFSSNAFPFSTSKFIEFKSRIDLQYICTKNLNKFNVRYVKNIYKLDYILINNICKYNISEKCIISKSNDFALIDVNKFID